ncbi:hypothetical protein PtrSN002B_005343 [Pyrenophora tritici-repentis]|nr:hypothetical protein PtrV1_05445 [Pyrenophora tritici-repentis]KAF7450188.1 hypothetical protein A1F99_048040 [Pyrenophora tritici-repentis]KAG9376158.1 hypothetical protein A1F94_013424 [Pyrenophora tritici-repentis]KAI0583200.1 hypothetical protein Alg130_05778 [Pyrenophora tritici-repentis]KAI0588090.1 hypothetical protein Alg215_01006 [Pyrenophora tritici-repentis]
MGYAGNTQEQDETAVVDRSTDKDYMPSAMYLVDTYTVHAASTIFRCLLGAPLPLVGPAMFDNLDLGWGNSEGPALS